MEQDTRSQFKFIDKFNFRYGASPYPPDDGVPPVIALFDKLIEYQDRHYPYQLETCLKLLLRTLPSIDLPFKVSTATQLYLERSSINDVYLNLILQSSVFTQPKTY